MCLICNRNIRRNDGWKPPPLSEDDEEDDSPRPGSYTIPPQKTIVQPAPSHSAHPAFAAYEVPEPTPETESALRPLRPPFGCVVYDTTATARSPRSARLARALFDRTTMCRRVDKSRDSPDRIEVVTFPLPETASNQERAEACVAHYEREVESRMAMADKAELVSWFLPERFMDSYYSRMILAIKRFEVDDDDDVEIASWEPALTRERFAMSVRRTESRYGSYLLIKWLPQKELFAEVDNPGYTAQKRVVCGGEFAFENIGSGLRDATNEVAVFYYHYVQDGLLDQHLENARATRQILSDKAEEDHHQQGQDIK
ncbi:hypothetical protein CGLO_11766 [Colletotrichum gloeosporioides Cg-14]|uniref:Uncharacterized protein n=1 Tax=Colletotrichum gloeosporioides (strain Cg-14) TaxID=1237896 RepID=T0K7M2_COLGC|nr:hypothetical protein CGLO_11766 [Colletotrichum gloeosporioides Cg-14]